MWQLLIFDPVTEASVVAYVAQTKEEIQAMGMALPMPIVWGIKKAE